MTGGGLLFLLLAVAAVAVFGLPFSLGLVPPWNAATVVRIRAGKITMGRGQLRGQVRGDVEEVLGAAGVTTGFVALASDKRVHFSRNIPEPVRQRLRNVLLN